MARPKRRNNTTPAKVKKEHRPCTYELGYLRQDLYACRKCTAAAKGVHSGFCRGCRDTCHADHLEEIFELYTKRGFRCDCGNTRAGNKCHLQPDKDDVNVGNQPNYSHNFDSQYCRCNREYDLALAMAQCAMCEDWFHEECFETDALVRGGAQAVLDEYEFTCKACVAKLPLLTEYYNKFHAWVTTADVRAWRGTNARKACTRPRASHTSAATRTASIDLLWRPGFRVHLCQCSKCMVLYRASNALYMVDRTDFVNCADDDDVLDVFVDVSDEQIVNACEEIGNPPLTRKQRMQAAFSPESGDCSMDLEEEANGGQDMDWMTDVEHNQDSVRERMYTFLQDLTKKNDDGLDASHVDRERILEYVSDLKKDLDTTFEHSW